MLCPSLLSPSIFLLAMRTTVSLIPRSDVAFLRAPISEASSASHLRSSSRSAVCASSGEAGGGGSQRRMNNTKTHGTSSVCFRTHIGAMIPSGYNGEDGLSGERGERGIGVEPLVPSGWLVPSDGTIFRGGNLTFYCKHRFSTRAIQ